MTEYLLNGTSCPAHEGLGIESRSHRYGDGFFESIRIGDGRFYHWPQHLERMHKTAMLLHMHLPEALGSGELETAILAKAKERNWEHCRLRLSFHRKGEGLYTPSELNCDWVAELSPLQESQYPWNEQGLSVGHFKELTKNSNYLSSLKTQSALLYVMAGLYAESKQLDEVLIFNDYGRVAEGRYSNVFLVQDEFLITPPISEYGIDGVMRRIVLQLADAYGYSIQERPVTETDVTAANELFFTSAIKGIEWVNNYLGKPYKCSVSKVLHQQLNASV